MPEHSNPYELHYAEALDLLKRGGSADQVLQYIDGIEDEDHRDATLSRIARSLASQGQWQDSLRFCGTIQDPLEHTDALFGVGRELAKRGDLESAKTAFRKAVEAAGRIKPHAWETPAIFLQVSSELWSLGEKDDAWQLIQRSIKLAVAVPRNFEADKTLRGCARLLAKWNHLQEASEVAQRIESPELRKVALEEMHGRGQFPVTPESDV